MRAATYRSKLLPMDALITGTHGLRGRKGRTLLTAIGIAIGIASMVAVLGISASSRSDLLAQIDSLGTNLLRIEAGQSTFGDRSKLPNEAPEMVRRIGPVQNAASVSELATKVSRNGLEQRDNGLAVISAEPHLLDTLEGTVAIGRFLDSQTGKLPTVVLGSVAAGRLGITGLEGAPTVQIAGQTFAVIGILDPVGLAPEVDRSVIVGNEGAATYLQVHELVPTTIYLRTQPEHLDQVRSVLPQTVNPTNPNEVQVTRPSDALAARAQVDANLQNLLLGLGGVALIVGAVGIANVMVISVLERRSEIGLRRALGATRGHIAGQFVLESALLAALGGLLGTIIGALVTISYASRQGWLIDIPLQGLAGGTAAALIIGALAGLYPAGRAARLDPAEAVRPA